MRWLLIPLLALLLMGQDCAPTPPPEQNPQGGTDYCYGLEYSVWDSVVEGVKGAYNTIIGGEESTNRRATVQIFFGSSYCTGVVLSPHTVLTAAHCGYAEGVEHRIKLDGHSEFIISNESLVHPDYWGWVRGGDLEARKSDLMLLYTDEEIPGPYIELTRLYSSVQAPKCFGLIAHGWGRDEYPETGAQLRESKYKITQETSKYIKSVMTDVGKICFGDSGGPLYADVGPGTLHLAGITTTTMSMDCLRGGTHVKLFPVFKDWLQENLRP
ncbi:MAG: S1 family peptidase [Candidatus Tectomicrobia bacterium]|nr:S1 family peptidase [Candidatus Tectomicrobia bacterium]